MTDSGEIFDRAFRSYGGRLHLSDVDPALATRFSDWRSFFTRILDSGNARPFPPGPIYLDYVDNPSINAIASISQGRELIGFFAGASGFVLHCLAALSSLPDAYGGVGRVITEVNPTEVGRLIKTSTRQYHYPEGPDKVRASVVSAAETIVHFFLYGHEVGHHVYGHVWYLNRQFGTTGLAEADSDTSPPSISADNRQLLELDADIHGATVSLNWWMRVHPRWTDISGSGGATRVDAFYLWAFSLGALMRIFDLNGHPVDPLASHPAADLRFANVYIAGLEEILARAPDEEDHFHDQVRKASNDLEGLWAQMRLRAPSFTAERSKSLGARMKTQRERWETFKDSQLDPIAFQRADGIRAKSGSSG